MQDRIIIDKKETIPYCGGPRNGKRCRPRQRADGVWAIDPVMGDDRAHTQAVPRGQYEYRATPTPHMKWVPNPEYLKASQKAAQCRNAITAVVDTPSRAS